MKKKILIFVFFLLVPLLLFAKNKEKEEDKSFFVNSVGMRFVLIPSGEFMMGSPQNEYLRKSDEKQYKVIFEREFYMQEAEVTVAQWIEVMGTNPYKPYLKDMPQDISKFPVANITWLEANDFVKKLNEKEKTDKYKLPTEAQWEYSARAGTGSMFFYGDCLDGDDEANFDATITFSNCPKSRIRNQVVEVKANKPNKWGLYDMYGNVAEWCSDWYSEYPIEVVVSPQGAAFGQFRVVRGGSFFDYAGNCRSASRSYYLPDYPFRDVGFRLQANAY